MNNRDFFTKPNQANGRSASDYGRSEIEPKDYEESIVGIAVSYFIGATVFAIMAYAYMAA